MRCLVWYVGRAAHGEMGACMHGSCVCRDYDIGDSVQCLRYYAGWADKIAGQVSPIHSLANHVFFGAAPERPHRPSGHVRWMALRTVHVTGSHTSIGCPPAPTQNQCV